MGLEIGQALALVATLEMELTARSALADRADDYYRGNHKLRFASEEFRDYFAKRYHGFSDNWVPVVADSPVERLTVQGFQPYDGKPDKELWRVWLTNQLDCDSKMGFLDAVKGARAFARVWGDPADDTTPLVTFASAAEAIVGYYPGSRYKRRAALRRWQDGNHEYCCLYTADELWKFSRPLSRIEKTAMMAQVDELADKWLPMDPSETGDDVNPQFNPMGEVPIVELANRPLLTGDPLSDVEPVIALQDSVNMLWALLFTAADYAAIPQRYVLGAETPKVPILDDQGNKIGERPVDLKDYKMARMLWVPDEGASAGSWPAAQLSAYSDIIETAIGHLAAQTRTPQHYLIGKMANLSSDALIAAEAGLVKRVEEKKLWFGSALREVARLIWLAKRDQAKAGGYRAGKVLWADSESRSQAQLVGSLVQLKGLGWPFEELARQYGLSPDEVGQLMAMRDKEAAQDPVLAALGTGGVQATPGGPPAQDVRPSAPEPDQFNAADPLSI
jgi:hypothetical protein